MALEMIFETAGIHPFVICHNNHVVSKTEKDAKDVLAKSLEWLEILQESEVLAPLLQTSKINTHEIKFAHTKKHIRSETQNKDALRGCTGHVRLDEHAAYQWAQDIQAAAIPATASNPRLRVSIVSTAKPHTLFQTIWEDTTKYHTYSRHHTDVYTAVDQGFNPGILKRRSELPDWVWQQEFEALFLGGEGTCFTKDLISGAYAPYTPEATRTIWIGLDVASVVDTTCATVVYVQSDGVWIGDVYQIANTPTETNVDKRIAGLELIVDALIRHLGAHGCVIDVTGDEARYSRGWTPLYTRIRQYRGHDTQLPQATFTQGWKSAEVGELKNALETGRTKLIQGRTDYLYQSANAPLYVVDTKIPETHDVLTPDNFVRGCFVPNPHRLLESDFMAIEQSWRNHGISYEVARSKRGHGDSFWSLICAHSFARIPGANKFAKKSTNPEPEKPTVTITPPKYTQMW